MKKRFIKITSLILVLSLLLSSSPSLFLVYGKCDPDDTDCKLKKEAKKSCSSADDVESCREGRKRAQEELNKEKAQKQSALVSTQAEITDPQYAGDLAWNSCKEGGGSEADCRSRAEQAYLEVEKDHPVDAATKEAHIVRDTLRKTALESIPGGSEALTAEQAERIRQESNIASTPALKKEYQEDFNQQLINKYGQDVTDEEIRQYYYGEYYQQNRDRYALPLSTESDLAGLGKDLLNRASVTEYLNQQLGPEPEPEMTKEQKLARIESNVQQLVQQNCQSVDLVVELQNAMEYSGYYRCRDGKKITNQEASRLKSQKRLLEIKEAQIVALEQKNQDFIPATMVSPKQIESMRKILESMADTFRQRKDPLGDNDSDGVLNFTDCAPDDEKYQSDCPDQVGASPQYEVYYSDANDLQIKGVITNNGQLVAGKIILEGINPETGKYEVIPVEFDRYGQFTSNPFNLTIGPLVEPVILQVIVYMDGKPRRLIVPIIPSEGGVFSIQNIHLEDYAVGTEDELIKQIREKYNLNLINGTNPENLWTAQEIQWFEETMNELPPIFWQTETTDFYRNSNDRYLGTTETRALYNFYPLLGSPVITLSDGIYSLNNRTWTANAKSDDTKGFFQQILVHELTHAIQYHDPNSTPLETIITKSNEWDKAHPEVYNWTSSVLGAINTYSNPLVQDYMKTIGWEVDLMTVSLLAFREARSDNPSVYEDAPTAYAKTNPLEDMSESAMLYVANPEYLRNRSPERYEWIKNNIFSGREYLTGSSNNNLFQKIIKKISLNFPSFQLSAQANQSLPPTSLEKIESVKTGMSRNEIINILGEPISERTISGNTFLSYSSSNPQIAHVIVMRNSQVVLIDIYKGAENSEKLSEFIENYGEPEEITYSYFTEGARTSIYAKQGLALTNLEGGEYIVKKQIFSPMPTEQFLETLGRNLPLSNPFIQRDFSTPNTPENTYQLLEGWNFVSFSVMPMNFGTASELITDAARQGAYVTTVGRWDGSRWQEYIQRGEEAYGQDFPIEPGVAYMLRNHVHLQTWVVSGFRISSSIPLELKTGFNSVGIPYSESEHTASSVLDRINLVKDKELTPEAENADLISRFVSGNWDVFIKRIYSEDNLQEYGNNFKILPAEGYFIKVKEEVNWTP